MRTIRSETSRVRVKRWLCLLLILVFFSVQGCSDSKHLAESMPEDILREIPVYQGDPSVEVHGNVPYFKETMATAFDGYGPLDELGRCTMAYACIGKESMPAQPRESISSVYPSGWNDARYSDIDGEKLFNRCHLIGFQLTGQNENARNLITGTRYMNIEGMLPFENTVAEYVRSTGNHVMYRVTPVYEGSNPIAAGVLMEAKSVEDSAVQYCVFCYNVQPGIEIDYTTGESFGENRIEEVMPLGHTKPFPANTESSGTDRSTASNRKKEYVLNKKSKRFHYPECAGVSQMKESNRQYTDLSREELINAGYKPCGDCQP